VILILMSYSVFGKKTTAMESIAVGVERFTLVLSRKAAGLPRTAQRRHIPAGWSLVPV